jgi:hypothetical protein
MKFISATLLALALLCCVTWPPVQAAQSRKQCLNDCFNQAAIAQSLMDGGMLGVGGTWWEGYCTYNFTGQEWVLCMQNTAKSLNDKRGFCRARFGYLDLTRDRDKRATRAYIA